MPSDREVVLGLVTTKKPRLESVDELRRRIRRGGQAGAARAAGPEPAGRLRQHDGRHRSRPDDRGRKLEPARGRAPRLGPLRQRRLHARSRLARARLPSCWRSRHCGSGPAARAAPAWPPRRYAAAARLPTPGAAFFVVNQAQHDLAVRRHRRSGSKSPERSSSYSRGSAGSGSSKTRARSGRSRRSRRTSTGCCRGRCARPKVTPGWRPMTALSLSMQASMSRSGSLPRLT